MDAHTKSVPPWQHPKKVLLILNRAQAFSGLLAPLNFTTPFCENRYQKLAALAERCCYFCDFIPLISENRAIFSIFSVLHRAVTAFAYSIRAPPSEV